MGYGDKTISRGSGTGQGRDGFEQEKRTALTKQGANIHLPAPNAAISMQSESK